MTTMLSLLLVITIVAMPYPTAQLTYSNCASKEKCDECIQEFGCVWCADPIFQDKRCAEEGKSRCDINFLMNPKIEATANISQPLTVVAGKNEQNNKRNMIQLSPQRIDIQLRPNADHPFKFTLSYGQAKGYPVDLYYLMDLSSSMTDDQKNLAKLGKTLADTMTKMTSNFRIGFGSFVDKVALPYVSIVPKDLREPCPGCAAPYGFQNNMALSTDTFKFADKVKSAKVSGNIDLPEGGFDAIMQVIVCPQIGWRESARKFLIVTTDAPFHIAGDGRLAGIIKPNDGCCHLDSTGLYMKSVEQDYPSVWQINQKVKEHAINLIFAITNNQTEVYKRLENHIEGASLGTLEGDSSNVVQLVTEQYNRITSAIEMRERNLGNYLRVKYFTRCLNPRGPLMETKKCDGLKMGQKVDFDIELELLQCPPNRGDWEHRFSIYPVGVNEEMVVNVKMLCDCNCSSLDKYEQNSPRCSYHGNLVCGLCKCINGYWGKDCSCIGEAAKMTDKCRQNSAAPICSDHGVCKCNKCHCNAMSETEVYWGDFCQCDNFTCPRVGGNLCSGHGDCVCGKCRCMPGWIGDDCSCEDSTSNCTIGHDTEVCSGHGTCVCNNCECNPIDGYVGKFCDKYSNFYNKCPELRDCVECKVHNTGKLSKEECDKCNINIEVQDFIEVVTDQDIFCLFYDDQHCKLTFKYEFDNNKTTKVTAQKEKECSPPVRILSVTFTIICSTVFIGLAFLLFWEFFMSIRDRRKFAKSQKNKGTVIKLRRNVRRMN